MSSTSRPYLARALYEWLLDNELTPYMVIDAELPGVTVPRQFVQNGQIVLNVSPDAVRDLVMENAMIAFNARFGGQPMRVEVPIDALVAVYARENGVGMVFGHEPIIPGAEDDDDADVEESGPALRSVESPSSESVEEERAPTQQHDSESDASGSDSNSDKGAEKKRPSLRVIK
ncbi:ClpXP protease specificity-enhancing factor [Larsenimonas suaedae]|uniref:ClpXP protease specificity-enhancing factor n=1 Tax=Larsenimonas suaedae TaxID=1851019 RepID=A0ABU1GUS1_9GAMM|nr:ClpXP protease specificity-enhancing factor [Larsenimonas suaedae]MCM2971025.1 ClpXP protease specificity-enhancing factor [Larsenimonas suaedae]MDR5895734.1 ClpXP protease specificity-enhancing factor [Larsenimonas suaedae]